MFGHLEGRGMTNDILLVLLFLCILAAITAPITIVWRLWRG